jgi:uncharacterized membrane protein (DUF373 family)
MSARVWQTWDSARLLVPIGKTGLHPPSPVRNPMCMATPPPSPRSRIESLVIRGLTSVEDLVYIGLGAVLAATALCLLFLAVRNFALALIARSLFPQVVGLLDQILLILLIIELMYTVQVSLREHTLVAEPFLVVALIAIVRKILVLITQISEVPGSNEPGFRHSIMLLALLALMVLVLVGSLIMLQRHARAAEIHPHEKHSGLPQ